MRKKIKELIQDTERPIVFSTNSLETKQELYLCRYEANFFIEGQPIPKGTYLLANKSNIERLLEYVPLAVSEESISAFVLPYFEKGVGMLTLDDSADLVVTPRLTGCTFAAELNTTTPTLLHLNKVMDIETDNRLVRVIDQEAIDAEIVAQIYANPCFTLKKDEYILSEKNCHAATVMGFKQDSGLWEYYSQVTIFNEDSNSYEIVRGKQATVSSSVLSRMGDFFSSDQDKKPEENLNINSRGCTLF